MLGAFVNRKGKYRLGLKQDTSLKGNFPKLNNEKFIHMLSKKDK